MGKKRGRSRSRSLSLEADELPSNNRIETNKFNAKNEYDEVLEIDESNKKKPHDNMSKNNFTRHNRLERMHSESRRNLPVYKHKSEICRLVAQNEVLLVVAETVSFTGHQQS